MELTADTLKLIRKSKRIKARLMLKWDISSSTMQNWLDRNEPTLCHIESLGIISNETGKMIPELVTDWSDTLQESLTP